MLERKKRPEKAYLCSDYLTLDLPAIWSGLKVVYLFSKKNYAFEWCLQVYFKSLENKTRNNGSQERQDTFLKSGVAPWYGGLHSGSTLRRSTVLISMGTSYFHILFDKSGEDVLWRRSASDCGEQAHHKHKDMSPFIVEKRCQLYLKRAVWSQWDLLLFNNL